MTIEVDEFEATVIDEEGCCCICYVSEVRKVGRAS